MKQPFSAIQKALDSQHKLALQGFDWSNATPIVAKIKEELEELEQALASDSSVAIEEEYGDLLLVLVNLARHLRIAPEASLDAARHKLERRWQHLQEKLLAHNMAISDCPEALLEQLWQRIKSEEACSK